MPDPKLLQTYLDRTTLPRQYKAKIWDAIFSGNADLKSVLDSVPATNTIRRDVWDIAYGQFTQDRLNKTLGYSEVTGTPASLLIGDAAEKLPAEQKQVLDKTMIRVPTVVMPPVDIIANDKEILKPTSKNPDIDPRVKRTALDLGYPPEWIHNLFMGESSGKTTAVNPITGASGLIQFMPDTAKALGTSVEAIRKMSVGEQLSLVKEYLKPYSDKIENETDLAMAVFYPAAIGNPDYVFPQNVQDANNGIKTPREYMERVYGKGKNLAVPEEKKFDEAGFKQWYKEWADKTGLNPNPDDPLHYYDYRAAYAAGVNPEINPDDGKYHWPSEFKSDDHPNRFVPTGKGGELLDTKYNRVVSPEEQQQIAQMKLDVVRRGGGKIGGKPVVPLPDPNADPYTSYRQQLRALQESENKEFMKFATLHPGVRMGMEGVRQIVDAAQRINSKGFDLVAAAKIAQAGANFVFTGMTAGMGAVGLTAFESTFKAADILSRKSPEFKDLMEVVFEAPSKIGKVLGVESEAGKEWLKVTDMVTGLLAVHGAQKFIITPLERGARTVQLKAREMVMGEKTRVPVESYMPTARFDKEGRMVGVDNALPYERSMQQMKDDIRAIKDKMIGFSPLSGAELRAVQNAIQQGRIDNRINSPQAFQIARMVFDAQKVAWENRFAEEAQREREMSAEEAQASQAEREALTRAMAEAATKIDAIKWTDAKPTDLEPQITEAWDAAFKAAEAAARRQAEIAEKNSPLNDKLIDIPEMPTFMPDNKLSPQFVDDFLKYEGMDVDQKIRYLNAMRLKYRDNPELQADIDKLMLRIDPTEIRNPLVKGVRNTPPEGAITERVKSEEMGRPGTPNGEPVVTGTAQESAPQFLPDHFRDKMRNDIKNKTGEDVSQYTDQELTDKYESLGLARGPQDEAPVAQGGSMGVRGETTKQAIESLNAQAEARRTEKVAGSKILPDDVRKQMVKDVLDKTGEDVSGLSDTDLSKKHESEGLGGPIAATPKTEPPRLISGEAAEAAYKRIVARSNQLNAMIDPSGIIDLAILGAYHLENGARSLAQFSAKMAEQLGDKYEAIKSQIERIYREALKYEQKQWILRHYSKVEDITSTDPNKAGTGTMTGKEGPLRAQRKRAGVLTTDFYQGSYPRTEERWRPGATGSVNEYVGVGKGRIYPGGDPLGLHDLAGNDLVKFEKLVKERGFSGYESTDRDVVAMFDPVEVARVHKEERHSIVPTELRDGGLFQQFVKKLEGLDEAQKNRMMDEMEIKFVNEANLILLKDPGLRGTKIRSVRGTGAWVQDGIVSFSGNRTYFVEGPPAKRAIVERILQDVFDQYGGMSIRFPSRGSKGGEVPIEGENIRSAIIVKRTDGMEISPEEMTKVIETFSIETAGALSAFTATPGWAISVFEPIFDTRGVIRDNAHFRELAGRAGKAVKKIDKNYEVSIENVLVRATLAGEKRPAEQEYKYGESELGEKGQSVRERARREIVDSHRKLLADAEEQIGRAKEATRVKPNTGNAAIPGDGSLGNGVILEAHKVAPKPVNPKMMMADEGAAIIAEQGPDRANWEKQIQRIFGDQAPSDTKGLDKLYKASLSAYDRLVHATGKKGLTSLERLLALALGGRDNAEWYEKSRAAVEEVFGRDRDVFLSLLAATSANRGTTPNLTLALKAYSAFKTGRQIRVGTKTDTLMANQAAAGLRFGGAKIQAFVKALGGDPDAVVLDLWMARALGIVAEKGSNKKEVFSDAQNRAFVRYIRRAASHAGLTPAQMQAAIWSGIKKLSDSYDQFTDAPFSDALSKIVDRYNVFSRRAEEILSTTAGGFKSGDTGTLLREVEWVNDPLARDPIRKDVPDRRLSSDVTGVAFGVGMYLIQKSAGEDDKDALMAALFVAAPGRLGKSQLALKWAKTLRAIRQEWRWDRGLGWAFRMAEFNRNSEANSGIALTAHTQRVFNRWVSETLRDDPKTVYAAWQHMWDPNMPMPKGIDPKVQIEIGNARDHIQRFGQLLVDEGYAPEQAQGIILANLGRYLPIAHKAIRNEYWVPSEKVVANAVKEYISEEAAKGNNITPEEARNALDNMLREYIMGEPFEGKSAGHAIPMNQFIARKNIPPWFHQLLGQITNPAMLYSQAMYNMSLAIANARFLRWISKQPGMVSTENTQAPGLVKMPKDPRWGDLASTKDRDVWVPEELWDYLSSGEKKGKFDKILDFMTTYVAHPAKAYMTLGNPPTWTINIAGDALFGFVTGLGNPWGTAKNIKKAIQTVYFPDSHPNEASEYARRIGVQGMAQGELSSLTRSISGRSGASSMDLFNKVPGGRDVFDLGGVGDAFYNAYQDAKHGNILGLASNTARGVVRAAAKNYDAPDQILRVLTYERYVDRFMKKGIDPEAAKNLASEMTLKLTPNYFFVPPALRAISNIPILPTQRFLSFPSEVLRITKNAIMDPKVQELDPAARWRALSMIVGAFTIPYQVASWFGISMDDFKEAVGQVGKDWMAGQFLIPVGKEMTKSGVRYQYYNLNKYIPQLSLLSPIIGAYEKKSGLPFMRLFVSEQDVVSETIQAALAAFNDKAYIDSYERTLFTSETGLWEKIRTIGSYAFGQMPFNRNITTLGAALSGNRVGKFEHEISPELAFYRNIGFGPTDFYVDEARLSRQKQFVKEWQRVSAQYRSVIDESRRNGDMESAREAAKMLITAATSLSEDVKKLGEGTEVGAELLYTRGGIELTQDELEQLELISRKNPDWVIANFDLAKATAKKEAVKARAVDLVISGNIDEAQEIAIDNQISAKELLSAVERKEIKNILGESKGDLMADYVAAIRADNQAAIDSLIPQMTAVKITQKDMELIKGVIENGPE